jgi:hypothetical protein
MALLLLLAPLRCCCSCLNRAIEPNEEVLEAAREALEAAFEILEALDFLEAADSAAETEEAAEASELESLQVFPRSSYILRSCDSNRWP